MYTLDTNAIIYYLKGEGGVSDFLEELFEQETAIYISTITELELFSFSNLPGKEITQIESLLTTLSIIPLDSRLARIAGFLRRQYHLKTPDSAIAATAIFTNSTLVTRDESGFQRVKDLEVLPI